MPKKQHSIISEDENCFHVHDGEKNFIVAKQGLEKNLHERIRSLPKYAMGGVVDSVDAEGDEDGAESMPDWMESGFKPGIKSMEESWRESAAPRISKERVAQALANPDDPFAKNYPGELKQAAQYHGLQIPEVGKAPASVETPQEVIAETPVVTPQAVAQEQQQVENAAVGAPILQQLKAGQAMQAQGIRQEADVAGKIAADQQQIYDKLYSPEVEKANQERAMKLQAQLDTIDKENSGLYEAAFANKIDPNRVWNNMSSGNKVMATIAIILGGLGSGGNAENNAALKVINKAIDDDINAQIKQGENAKQLYQLNLQRYRDTQTALEATRMQMNSIAQGQLAALAAKYGGETAKAKAQSLLGMLQQQNAVTQSTVAGNLAKASGKSSENFVPGYGYAQVKPSEEDKSALASVSSIKNGLRELQQRAIKGGPTIKGSSFDNETKTKISGLKLQLKTLFKLGQISETDAALIDPLVSDPGSWRTEKAVRQLEAAIGVVNSVEDATLAKLGLQRPQQQKRKVPTFEEFKKMKAEGKL